MKIYSSAFFRYTRGSGYQEEKYESLYIRLRWNTTDLTNVVNFRVNQLLKDKYTNRIIFSKDVLPNQILQQSTMQYIVERTLRVPRDIIMFINMCLAQAGGKTRITQKIILAAETQYSHARLKMLGDEWSSDYTDLVSLALSVFKKNKAIYKLGDVDLVEFQDKMLTFLTQPRDQSTDTYKWIYKEVYEYDQPDQLLYQIINEFFKIGIVGVKLDTYREVYWSHMGKLVSETDLTDDTKCYIHPAFYRVLGVEPHKKKERIFE